LEPFELNEASGETEVKNEEISRHSLHTFEIERENERSKEKEKEKVQPKVEDPKETIEQQKNMKLDPKSNLGKKPTAEANKTKTDIEKTKTSVVEEKTLHTVTSADVNESNTRKPLIHPVRNAETVEERREVWSEMIEQRKMHKESKLSALINTQWREHIKFEKMLKESSVLGQDETKKDDKSKANAKKK